MSEWRRTPLAMHQRRGAGGGVRACGARARERAERSAGSRESTGQRDSIADGTALRSGRVGSRHIERVPLGTLFFCACYATLSTLQCCTEGTDVYCRVVLVKRLRRTENVRGTFEGVSAPRECGQPSPLPAHRNNRSSEAR